MILLFLTFLDEWKIESGTVNCSESARVSSYVKTGQLCSLRLKRQSTGFIGVQTLYSSLVLPFYFKDTEI